MEKLYAFFVRAEERAIGLMLDTSSDEKWVNNIRRAVNMPNVEVNLVEEDDWSPPGLDSVNEDPKKFIPAIQNYFKQHNLLPMSQADFKREHLGDLKSEMTGLMVILIKHAG